MRGNHPVDKKKKNLIETNTISRKFGSSDENLSVKENDFFRQMPVHIVKQHHIVC